jgi:hypothetical protein
MSPLILAALLATACQSPSADLSFFVLVKSSNYSQDSSGVLTLLNYHFFSEIFLKNGGAIRSAALQRDGTAGSWPYEDRESNHYFEGGHFDTVEEADSAYPNGAYTFDIETPSGRLRDVSLMLAGPGGKTDIPAPITISLLQSGREISPVTVDATLDLTVRWSEYSNGQADPRGIVDDMIFVVVADCHGERIFHTGLPFQGDYTTFRETEAVVPAAALSSGMAYSAFVEFPHVADSRVVKGVPGFTSFATATYLDLHTTGTRSDLTCPERRPPMDTGQTDRQTQARQP